MAKTRKQKEKNITELEKNLDKMKTVVFSDFTHLTVSDMQDLRKRLKQSKADLMVAKKTLFHLALGKNKDLAGLSEEVKVTGPLALAFGYEDESAPAKILAKFQKEHKDFKILGWILDYRFLRAEQVLALAKLPGREEMRAQAARTIAAPLAGFVNVLAGNIRNLIYVLKNISEKSAA